jgi:hypothetical protein
MIIETATEKNRKALALRLETEFAALPADIGRDKEDGSAFLQLSDKVIFAPHKELIPLALKLLDRCPKDSHITESTYRKASELVETIFNADPAVAHRIFVDRLLTSPVHEHAFIAFDEWRRPGGKLAMYLDEVLVRNEVAVDCVIRKPWLWTNTLKAMFRWFSTSAPKVLPDEELARLLLAKDPRVQTHVSNCFRHRLDRDGKLIGVPK